MPHEIPLSDRSNNPFTRAAQERDRALLPEPVQALLRELFEKQDQHAKDEARIGAEIEKAMTERATAVAEPRLSMGRGRALGRLRIAVEHLLAQLHEDDRTIGIDIWKTVRAAREALDAIPPVAGPAASVAEPRSERDAAIVRAAEAFVPVWKGGGSVLVEARAIVAAVDLPKGAPVLSDAQRSVAAHLNLLEAQKRIRTLESNLDQAATALEQSAQRVADLEIARSTLEAQLITGREMLEHLEKKALPKMGDWGSISIGKGTVAAIGELQERLVKSSGASFRKALAAAFGIESDDPREDVLLARVRELAGGFEQGRRNGWIAGSKEQRRRYGGHPSVEALVPYEPVPAKNESEKQEGSS